MMYHNVALARQPIVDNKLSTMGYELLYRRDADAVNADVYDQVGATAQVITTCLLDLGLHNIVGTGKAFVNFPRGYLVNPSGVPLPKEHTVIEVLESAGFDAVLLASLRRWHNAGFKIALDDFVYEPRLTPFVEIADYVKLDMLALGKDKFHQQVEALRPYNVKLIAEKVETWDDYHFAKLLDVDYYQGYFFEKPQAIAKKASTVNQMTLMHLMASLMRADDMSISELEEFVGQDIGLVHKLLKYLNSPLMGLVASVDSLRLAIMLIGTEQLKSITNLLLMSDITADREVLQGQVLLRAKHAELFAKAQHYANEERYFLAGMLSMIDVCVGIDLDDILAELPLPLEFTNAILERTGRVGYTLDLIEAYEKNRPIKSDEDMKTLARTYAEAVTWVESFRATL
ncbi:EAL and HDOD domain-containing protein [Marinomonas fungiae]|uniref:C-di-GMP-related signal transduction protein, contains EAL and HDOD domains n=1 Tax=Marinomonas fungiae TaxID=1137284 RepID=A0A0K6IRK2_9GAMM|nr:HDOD domain-containing protein [Marinomonas fungiae]CUB05735.1 c-di-GMP-related signal transduction protein, contains EAL and HDOD domains [Marinomonas fungiae]